ncbi:uncharacterized protein LOC106644416, partial [Copidosoma floridanum]|uniref:uncharacterized protein LOC106644416 n=1 Tax=Copidosoma floridanum TaxID=29053 RepID=UPI0006C9D0FB
MERPYFLQHSKSRGNVHRYFYTQQLHQPQTFQYPLQHQLTPGLQNHHSVDFHPLITASVVHQPYIIKASTSSGNLVNKSNRVHFSMEQQEIKTATSNPGKPMKSQSFLSLYGLRRSKSFTAPETLKAQEMNTTDASELGHFPSSTQETLLKAVD